VPRKHIIVEFFNYTGTGRQSIRSVYPDVTNINHRKKGIEFTYNNGKNVAYHTRKQLTRADIVTTDKDPDELL
jgi:galactokinase/mevalonate kinase-like predicted kinase